MPSRAGGNASLARTGTCRFTGLPCSAHAWAQSPRAEPAIPANEPGFAYVKKLKRIARVGLDRLAALSGMTALSESGMRRGLTVLTYHRVLPDALCADYPFPSLAVPESMFRGQMATLARRCRVVTLDEGLAQLQSGRPVDRPL